jgi:hypothetical protein
MTLQRIGHVAVRTLDAVRGTVASNASDRMVKPCCAGRRMRGARAGPQRRATCEPSPRSACHDGADPLLREAASSYLQASSSGEPLPEAKDVRAHIEHHRPAACPAAALPREFIAPSSATVATFTV